MAQKKGAAKMQAAQYLKSEILRFTNNLGFRLTFAMLPERSKKATSQSLYKFAK